VNPLLAGGNATVRASVKVMGMPMRPDAERNLARVVVDTHLHLPDTFELTFLDEEGSAADTAMLSIGTPVEVYGGAPDSMDATKLIAGEVTSIEAICADLHIYTVIRGYEQAHRLQRARRTRTFVDMLDSEAVEKVAKEAGLKIGTVDATSTTHPHLAQVAQTDWEFIKQRAREVGFETGVVDGKFFFKRPPGMPGGGGLGGLVSAVVDALGFGAPKLTFKDNLLTFLPRVSGANLTSEVEVRFWDAENAEAVTATTAIRSETAKLDDEPADLADAFGMAGPLGAILPSIPGLPSFGTPPSAKAFAVVNYPLASGSSASAAAEEMANGVAEHIASTFAEAEGYAVGHPGIQAGAQITVEHVPAAFAGKWTVTNARHTFDESEGGYHTRFWVSGRQERSLLGLTSLGATQGEPARIPGLVCGIVTNIGDPDTRGRVKVALPWLSPSYESDWARVAQFGAGAVGGALFLPDVGDEVLIGFEFGDPRRPYVLGGLINANTDYDLGGDAVKVQGMTGQVVRRGFVSAAKNHLLFEDELLPRPSTGPPVKSAFALETEDGSMGVAVSQTDGTLTITCEPAAPASKATSGAIEIVCGMNGTITIKTGTGGNITVEAGGTLELKGTQGVKIDAGAGNVEVAGTQIKLG
jgi:phage protein D